MLFFLISKKEAGRGETICGMLERVCVCACVRSDVLYVCLCGGVCAFVRLSVEADLNNTK